MLKHHRPVTAAAALALALLPAAGAQAATKRIDLGAAKTPKGTPEAAAFVDFFPRTVKVNAGDKVAFHINGFGAVHFGGGKLPALGAADPNAPVSGANGPDGQPFWFNGQPSIRINPFYLAPTGDMKVTGKGIDSTGLPMEDGQPKPRVFTFTKTGSFKFIDPLHPKVKGKVVVVPKGKKVPSAAADKAAAAKQLAKLVKEAKKAEKAKVADNTIRFGNDTRNVMFFKFFPGNLKVKAGQPIALETGKQVNDLHNLAIGPIEWMKNVSPFDVKPPTDFFLSATVAYPSQSPLSGPLTFDGTQNGGFVNSGALDSSAATALPSKSTLTITKPGSYTYYCLFHAPDMTGTITVE